MHASSNSCVEPGYIGRARFALKEQGRTEETRIASVTGSEKIARDAAARFAAKLGFSAERIEDIKMAVNEACLNAVEHSGSGPSEEILLRLAAEEGGLTIEVINKGVVPVIPNAAPNIKEKMEGRDRPRGWGVFLMKKLADEASFTSEHGITTVFLRFRH